MLDTDRSIVSKALIYFAGALLCLIMGACGGAPSEPGGTGPSFTFRWKIVDYRAADPSEAAPISCASVGAAEVGFAWERVGASGGTTYPCQPEGYARSEALPAGQYVVGAALLDDRRAVVSRIVLSGSYELKDTVELGRFVFVVRPL